MTPEKIVQKFAAQNGYIITLFYKKWNGFDVFVAEKNKDESIVGYPTYLLISEKKEVRFADPIETFNILEISFAPEGYSEFLD